MLVDDGSGRGAGFAAAVEVREATQHKAGKASNSVNSNLG